MDYNEGECLFHFRRMNNVTAYMAYIFAVSADEVLYGYGPLGVAVVALSAALGVTFRILMKDRDKAIADRDAMIEDLFTKVLPAIARNTEVLENRQILDRDLIEAVKTSNSLREETRLSFEQAKRTFEDFRRDLERIKRLLDYGGTPRVGGD